MNINNVLGKKLKDLRLKYGMTQDDIAEVLNMSRTTFSKYENGASSPPLSTMRKLSSIYNVSLDYLIYDNSSLISLNESDEDKLYDVSDSVKLFTQLSPNEKKMIMKFRLMNAEKQDEIINLIDNLEENN